jgi:hypothetical protein
MESLIAKLEEQANSLHMVWGLITAASVLREAAKALREQREELAKLIEEYPEEILHVYARGPGDPWGNSMRPVTRADLAAAVRHYQRKIDDE